tara:strand:- start:1795 stop:2442 length:648 start_codon:yes stop_codon:yes gene_type:complete
MADNLFEAQYDITKKSKLRKFYDSYKILIFSFILIFIISLGSFIFYLEKKEQKKILISENYIKAKIYLESGKKNEAVEILKEGIFSNDPTYSSLCFFIILNQELITNREELLILFDHLLQNNKFEKEVKNLLVFKKALFISNYANEAELLEVTKPLLNTETLWKPHALLLLGSYFASKKENLKAKEFYMKILNIKGLHQDIYNQASSQLSVISDD